MRAPLTLLLCATLAACGAHDTLAPGQWTGYVPAAESGEFEIRVRLAQDPPSLERIDILLLFDITQSMREVIDEVRGNAGTIMRAIRARNPNSAFGVASFADYQERMPWRLDRDITEDMDSVSVAITGCGCTTARTSPRPTRVRCTRRASSAGGRARGASSSCSAMHRPMIPTSTARARA